jgi:hypothetical protein
MNMFKPVNANTVSEYMAMLPPERKETIEAVDKLIKKEAPSLKQHFAYNMLGYGNFKYKNNKGEVLDWPKVSLASQKNYISLYICAMQDGKYIAEAHKDDLGNVSVGKSCIRFKKLEDLNLDGLKKVLKLAEESPGLV